MQNSKLIKSYKLLPGEEVYIETRPNYLAYIGGPGIALIITMFFPIVAVITVIAIFLSIADWRRTLYVMTNKRILAFSGILSRSCRQCPIDKLQNFEYKKYPFSNRGTILFDTAGTGAKEIVWRYIDNVEDAYHKISSVVHK